MGYCIVCVVVTHSIHMNAWYITYIYHTWILWVISTHAVLKSPDGSCPRCHFYCSISDRCFMDSFKRPPPFCYVLSSSNVALIYPEDPCMVLPTLSYISIKNQPHAGKRTIHGSFGIYLYIHTYLRIIILYSSWWKKHVFCLGSEPTHQIFWTLPSGALTPPRQPGFGGGHFPTEDVPKWKWWRDHLWLGLLGFEEIRKQISK